MSKIECINGTRFVDGYLCDDSGRPITMKNGYSYEDEQDALNAYEFAKLQEIEKAMLKKERAKINLSQQKIVVEEELSM